MEKYYNNNNYKQQIQSRTLEITIISGEDLRINQRPIKKNAYVIARCSDDLRSTAMDGDGGSYPTWNQKLELDAPTNFPAANLTLEVRCKTAFGDKIVGSASVPASDLSGGYVPESHLRFLSYRLRDSAGERNGIINISVRTRVPAPEVGKGCNNEIVIGFPIWTLSNNSNNINGKCY